MPVTVERGEAEQEAQPKAPRGGPAPERSLDMSALREVAVSNARTAIGQHQRQRVSKQLASQGGLLIALALTAVGMGWLWWANIVPWAIYGLAATSGLVLAFAAHVIMLMIGMRPAEEGMGRPSIETNRDVSPSDVAEDIVADEISISEKPSGEPMVSPATRAE